MTSFVEKDENDPIKEIEEQFLQELYNLKLEDLEKIATSNETENIPDNILNFFGQTNASLNEKTDVELTEILSSIKNDDDDDDDDNTASSSDEEKDDNNTASSSDEEKDDNTTASSSDEEKEEEEENTIKIEEQIKNSALEAVRYRIELEKETQYAGTYPRKKVGIERQQNTCYAISGIQMLYSLPYIRNYVSTAKDNKNDEKIIDFKPIFERLNENKTVDYAFFEKNIQKHCPNIPNQDAPDFTVLNNIDIPEFIVKRKTKYICENGLELYKKENDSEHEELSIIHIEYDLSKINDSEIYFSKLIEDTNKMTDLSIENKISIEACGTNNEVGPVKSQQFEYEIPHDNRYLIFQIPLYTVGNQGIDKKRQERIIPDNELIINNINYKLSGVIVHSGEGDGGHYTYYQCNENGGFIMKYDDNKVTTFVHEEQAVIHKNGYIFAYTRYPVNQPNVANKILQINTDLKKNQNVFRPINTQP